MGTADCGEYCEAVRGKRLPAARCAVTRRRVPSAETLEGRQCQFPLYEGSEIPLLLHRVLQPFPLAGASPARPTKRLEAPQICFSARRSWVLISAFANAGPAFCLPRGKRLLGRAAEKDSHKGKPRLLPATSGWRRRHYRRNFRPPKPACGSGASRERRINGEHTHGASQR